MTPTVQEFFFEETGIVKYYHILIPIQIVDEVFRSLHEEFGKHPIITKRIIAYRGNFIFQKRCN